MEATRVLRLTLYTWSRVCTPLNGSGISRGCQACAGRYKTAAAHELCPMLLCCSFGSKKAFHIDTRTESLSDPDMILAPSKANATLQTQSVENTALSLRDGSLEQIPAEFAGAVSHKRTVQSSEHDTSCCPLGLNATHLTK